MINSERLEEVILRHKKKYPLMQIQDMVKLIYQNEFAGGHLINNQDESLQLLKDELAGISDTSGLEPMGGSDSDSGEDFGSRVDPDIDSETFEDIGNGLCRLNLRGLRNQPVRPETINGFFAYTANSNKGSVSGFEDKLAVLRDLCERGSLPYAVSDLDDYLSVYRKKGFYPVSHSESYRDVYSPAYRVVSSLFRDYFKAFCSIDTLLNGINKGSADIGPGVKQAVNVAIEGNSGAGKSSLAELLQEIYDCNVFHMDHFFLTPDLRTEERLKEAGGNVDYVRFKNEVLNGLESGKEFSYQIYDCSKGLLDRTVNVVPKKLNIIEGSYSMHPTLANCYDLKIFLSIGQAEQSRRILERNGPFMYDKFISIWVPLENRYFSELDIQSQCDLVINV